MSQVRLIDPYEKLRPGQQVLALKEVVEPKPQRRRHPFESSRAYVLVRVALPSEGTTHTSTALSSLHGVVDELEVLSQPLDIDTALKKKEEEALRLRLPALTYIVNLPVSEGELMWASYARAGRTLKSGVRSLVRKAAGKSRLTR